MHMNIVLPCLYSTIVTRYEFILRIGVLQYVILQYLYCTAYAYLADGMMAIPQHSRGQSVAVPEPERQDSILSSEPRNTVRPTSRSGSGSRALVAIVINSAALEERISIFTYQESGIHVSSCMR